jgi:hypothetical protein
MFSNFPFCFRPELPKALTSGGRFDASQVYPSMKNVHSLWDTMSNLCGDYMALEDPQYGVTMTYKEVSAWRICARLSMQLHSK